jgi:hypothetical protein
MKRFSIAGLAAAATLALSLGASAPAEARVMIYFGGHHGHIGIWHPLPHCGWKWVNVKVKRHGKWQWVLVKRSYCW